MATAGTHLSQILVLISILSKSFVSGQNGYFFTMPKVLHEGDVSSYCLTMYSGPSNGTTNMTMSLSSTTDGVQTSVDDTYQYGVEKCTEFTVPQADTYYLLLNNDTEIFGNAVEIRVQPHSQITLIQTDKPMYKPGQKVKFRILTIQRNQKPRTGTIASVYVKDPNGSRVKQFLNIDSQGIASLEFQLSKEAKIGRWHIAVVLNETSPDAPEDETITFEVKEYVLPRFEVTITPPSYILPTDETIQGKVCAKYTYGKNVKGYLDLKVCGQVMYWHSAEGQCELVVAEMNGCHNFSVNATALLPEISKNHYFGYHGWQLQMSASVREAGTGNVVTASHEGPSVTRELLTLKLTDSTNGFFKPGLPFYGKVVVTKPDGQPAQGENINVAAFDYDTDVRMDGNFTTDEEGVAHYALCGELMENITRLTIMATAMDHVEIGDTSSIMATPTGNGGVKQWFSPSFSYIQIPRTDRKQKCGDNFTIEVPYTTRTGAETELRYQVIARGKMVTYGVYRHTQNDADSNLNMDTSNCLVLKTPPKQSTPPTDSMPPPIFPVVYADDNDDQKEMPTTASPTSSPKDEPEEDDSRDDNMIPPPPPISSEFFPGPVPGPFDPYGAEPPFNEPIVRSEYIADVTSSFLLEIPLASVMSPKFTLIINHVLPDGEIVADSAEFQVEPCFDNKVDMTFDQETVLPGADVNLQVEAEPGSVCGLGIVDKSVNILGGSHQITMDTIFKEIDALGNQYWPGDFYQTEREYCEQRVKNFLDDKNFYWDISSRYVDANEAFKSSGMLVLTDLKLETRPCQVARGMVFDYYGGRTPDGAMPGPVPLAGEPQALPVAQPFSGRNQASKKVNLRSHFPETWLWDLQVVGENGTLIVPQEAPHTITSWVGNAMCMDPEKGVGISPLRSLTTFQPFFLHVNLPYAAVRGERLPIMVTVHNHLDKSLYMKLDLDMGDSFKVHNDFLYREPFCVSPGDSYTARYYATPQDIGSLPIVAKAEIVPGTCNSTIDIDLTYVGLSDAVKRQMLVKAEGVPQEYTHSLYMCANDGEQTLEDVILTLPEGIVPDSERADVTVIGDIMGPALTNLDRLVRLPTGCGEQNMVGFTPNIYVLNYLTNAGLLTEEIHENAVKFMEIGYQRELNYRHRDGSYSAFGESDDRGSVWLTAFVVKSFAQATPHIFIDPKDIEQSVTFLEKSQLENGCFIETGKVFSSYMMGGLGKIKTNTALTSYVLIALLEAGVNVTDTVITEGFRCIDMELHHYKRKLDIYSLAVSAYANTLRDPFSQSTRRIMRILESKAKKDGSLKFWSRDGVQPPSTNSLYYPSAASAEVEMTSYALLAYLEYYGEGAIKHSHEIAMWLSHQRNPHGGFASTQDTVLGLNALSEFASIAYSDTPVAVNISVSSSDTNKTFSVSEEDNTKLLVQTMPIQKVPVRLRISAEGDGCALVQANVRYNKMPQNIGTNIPGFHLKILTRRYRHDVNRCDRKTINIAVGSRNMRKHSKGMSLVIVRMVTSWTPIKESLIQLESLFPSLGMKRYEHDETENVITFYFDEFTRRPREFALDVEQDRSLAVSNPKAAQVSVINYYETDMALVKSYSLKTICGTKAEIPIVPPAEPIDEDNMSFPVQRRVVGPRRIQPLRNPGPAGVQPATQSTQPPAPETTSSVPVPPACPVCSDSKTLPADVDMKTALCSASYVYKTISGRSKSMALKIVKDYKPEEKLTINKFANYTLPEGCQCFMLEPPLKRVFIITSTQLKNKHLNLDQKSVITFSTRKIERELMALENMC